MAKRKFYYFYFDTWKMMADTGVMTAETEEEVYSRLLRYNPKWQVVHIQEAPEGFHENKRQAAPFYQIENMIRKHQGGRAVHDLEDEIYANELNMSMGRKFIPYKKVLRDYVEQYEWGRELMKLSPYRTNNESEG